MRKGNSGFYKGVYIVENKEKYKGKNNPIYRSSWESKFCHWLDFHQSITNWCFECLTIPYFNYIDKKMHKYITDFCFQEIDSKGNKRRFVVEIKPEKQLRPPKMPKNKNVKAQMRYENECHVYAKNRYKWKAADEYCKKYGFEFRIVCLVSGDTWKVYSLKDII
jgi:hypothetical protein